MRQALGVRSSRVVAAVLSLVLLAPGALAADHPLKGQKIDMAILGIGGWLPSRLGVDMAPMFAKYAKEKFGYDVTFTFAGGALLRPLPEGGIDAGDPLAGVQHHHQRQPVAGRPRRAEVDREDQ